MKVLNQFTIDLIATKLFNGIMIFKGQLEQFQ